MAKRISGLKRVGYSDTVTGAITYITGKISTESSITFDNTRTETTDGVIYGGGSIVGDVFFLDYESFSGVNVFGKIDTEKFWTFEQKDGGTYVTSEAVNVDVQPQAGINARDGVVSWSMHIERYTHSDAVSIT